MKTPLLWFVTAGLRGVAALAAAAIVFVLIMWGWASFAQAAYAAGGRPYLRIANHIVMIVMGLTVAAVVIAICSRRDYVTPAIAGVVMFGLGVLGIIMIMVETDNRTDIAYTVADAMLVWLSYTLLIGIVVATRHRKRTRETDRLTPR